MKIYICSNNGVTAAISEETKALIEARAKKVIEENGNPVRIHVPYPHRIHTFCNSPHHKGWVNGTCALLSWLLKQSGAEVVRDGFYVPFSNGSEWMYRTNLEEAEEEWRFRTSVDELLEDFGLLV